MYIIFIDILWKIYVFEFKNNLLKWLTDVKNNNCAFAVIVQMLPKKKKTPLLIMFIMQNFTIINFFVGNNVL